MAMPYLFRCCCLLVDHWGPVDPRHLFNVIPQEVVAQPAVRAVQKVVNNVSETDLR